MREWIWLVVVAGCTSDITLKGTTEEASPPTSPNDPVESVPPDVPPDTTVVTTDPPVTTGTSFDCYAELVVDDDIDGTVDLRGYQGFDPDHFDRMLYEEGDFEDDGTVDYWVRRTFDVAGHVVHSDLSYGSTYDAAYNTDGDLAWEEEDGDGDGVPDWRVTWTWSAGLPTSELEDDGANGTVDWAAYWTYDDGRPTLYEIDENGDGEVDLEDVTTYDALGRMVSMESTFRPNDPQNRSVIRYAFTYSDPVLRIGSVETDDDADGSIDRVSEFESNTEGQYTYYATDWENDGVVDQELWMTYDAEGHELSFTERDYTYPESGPRETRVYEQTGTWDALGRQIELRIEAPRDTSSTTLITWTFGGTCPS